MVNTAADSARLEAIKVAIEALQTAGITVNGLQVDIADVDVAALIAGIAGPLATAKTLKDLHDKLSSDPATQTTLALIKTALDALAASGAGGYIRQDSTGSIAKETGGNLASVKTNTDKIPAQGQALAAASLPVVLPALQETALKSVTETSASAIASSVAAIPAKGTAAMAASMPVTIASDDALINVTKGAAYVTGGGSGQLLTCTNAATNYTATVVASAVYRVTATNGIIYLGIADSTVDANVLWVIPAGDTKIITIPSGTSLTYRSDAALVYGRLARIQ